ncbi:uncharacterized protein L969DRAFT_15407 [Mixia osmundae IAM 14324]|uniref:Bicarbonate transporter-like transmembrane domain-containing protein n=1 Tax=Mixia osmundae (strain CBS 9802 / IAM 14324 / JCM 22182 / KY 12970) TaxID=764103 RepID=G7DY28_MIXOS|nr:uncharacterized protein L969DRAFT_15407 [Mixia osmundae IAM 14324]KEI41390.1 hypothetical protein L969DRAFT_15407 [Mixia osmundae IAM 14324]GAA95488.1 hypothetical protein E5Q_02143 [Mixia osmundae IAM 14324]
MEDRDAEQGGVKPSNSRTTESGSDTRAASSDNTRTGSTSGDEWDRQAEGLPWSQRSLGYQYTPFRGICHDIKRRLPYYRTDWTIAFASKQNAYTTTVACIRMYFINLMPAIAYLLDMNHRTNGQYGLNEGILASALAAIVFPLFSCQPLTIVGVTGLINLFNYTNYDIVVVRHGVNYLQFQAWVFIWSAVSHWLVAIINLADYTRFITDMTSETFGAYVGVIYIQKGVELLLYEFDHTQVDGWLSVLVAVLFAICVYLVERVGSRYHIGPFWLRKGLKDYAFIAGILFFTGFVHIPGDLKSANIEKLPITRSFYPSTDRSWLVHFWELPIKWIFVAIPFGLLVTLLFYVDHQISSVMAQARQFPIKRPAGFHWDFFLLGITTLVSGLLGLPAPNGLVPQAPYHTEGLAVFKQVDDTRAEDEPLLGEKSEQAIRRRPQKVVLSRVVEQRVSHLAMGLLTLATMTRPFLVALGTMPRALFAGVFLMVGWASVENNGILHKTLFLLRDPKMTPVDHPLLKVSKRTILRFISVQWFVFGASVAVSQTLAGISFPVFFAGLMVYRTLYVPRVFSPEELAVLDSPTADSEAVLVSLGGEAGRATGEGYAVAPDTGIAGTEFGKEAAPHATLRHRARPAATFTSEKADRASA